MNTKYRRVAVTDKLHRNVMKVSHSSVISAPFTKSLQQPQQKQSPVCK